MNDTAAAFGNARREILRLRKALASHTIRLAEKIEQLEQEIPGEDAQEFLKARCGMSASEIRTYSKIGKRLVSYADVLEKHSVSYEVTKALASAKESVRGQALATIASGKRFDLADLRVLRRQLAERELSPFAFTAGSRRRAMKTLARRRTDCAIKNFETGASDLMMEIAGLECETGTPKRLQRSVRQITDKARTALTSFEAAFGSSHARRQAPEWRSLKAKAREAASVHETISRLAKLADGPDGSLMKRARHLAINKKSPLNSISAFVGHTNFMSAMLPPKKTRLVALPAKRLCALELCAGAGGMALGLEAAGFEHVALVELDRNAASTMRRNRPAWPVIQKDLTTIDFTQYAGKVDLVCGGLPCQPYSEEGHGDGKEDKRDLLLEGARAVREIQPRAFLFENVRGALFDKHSDQIARFLRELSEAGYDVQIAEVNTQDYGIAQNRPRILFIGMRTADRRNFEMPRKFPNRRANVGDALYDLMSANGWSGVDDWADYCRSVTFALQDGMIVQGAQASTLTGRKGKAKEKEALRWGRNGLDPAGVPASAPSDAIVSKKGAGFVPGLTIPMRARLQDFPDDYQFVGGKESVAKQIGNAVAPRMAQAVGLAIYAALELVEFDLEALLWPEEPRRTRKRVDPPPMRDALSSAPQPVAA